MSITHAKPGEVIDLSLAGFPGKTTTLAKTADLELIRLILLAGKDIPSHKAPGEITLQCLEGRVAISAENKTEELAAGQMVYLAAGVPHSLRGIEDSSLLVTMLLAKIRLHVPKCDVVQETTRK